MPRRAARDDRDLLERAERLVGDIEVLEEDIAPVERDAAEDRVARGRRLLVDLLEHEVLVAALLRRDRIPEHSLGRLRDGAPGEVGELDARPRDDGHFLVAEKHDVARVREDGRDVGGHEELVLSEPDDDRRAVANGDDLFGIVDRHEHEREHAAHAASARGARRFRGRLPASRARPGARRFRCRFRS